MLAEAGPVNKAEELVAEIAPTLAPDREAAIRKEVDVFLEQNGL